MESNVLASNLIAQHGMGIRVLTAAEESSVDLGPLKQLVGTWKGQPSNGWNVISVPGNNQLEFVLEVIPYEETLTFLPVIAATNRGPFVNDVEQNQELVGVMYKQEITSVCISPFCKQRGFDTGNVIHAESGFFLNVQNFNSGFDILRLATIPHGNSVLALGKSSSGAPPDNNFFGAASTLPTVFSGGQLPLDYGVSQFSNPQFVDFDQKDPNTFLSQTLGNDKITAMTILAFSTDNKIADGTQPGGILSIPFINQNIKTTKLDATFWIETIKSATPGKKDGLQLQYSQTINLVFPPTGIPIQVIWPHVTINTLQKV